MPKAPRPVSTTPSKDTKWAVASLVCGILGIVILILMIIGIPETMYSDGIVAKIIGSIGSVIFQIGFIISILAIVFYFKQKMIQPNGMATAGLVLGIISIIIYVPLMLMMELLSSSLFLD